MPGSKSFLAEQLSNFFEVAWLELPAEAARVLTGAGDEKALRKTGWKVYDAWLSLANELTNAIYSDPIVGEASGRMMEAALRLREISGTMTAAFFGNFWPVIGLPTHNEMVALREDLLALREEVASYAKLPVAQESGEMDAQDPLAALWKRAQLNGYRVNGSPLRRSSSPGKINVAA
jgi:hypothetical protein